MGKRLGRVLVLAVVFCVVAVGSACNKSKKDEAVGQGMENGGGPPPGMFGGPGGRPRGPIHQAMMKLFKGQPSLKDSIGQELTSDSPAWETIQPQAKEFAELAASLKNYDPPKGSKESWTKQATSFSESASALERAAKAKKKEDALAAHAKLSDNQTCKACHQEHKGPGGMGRPGGFRGRGGPPSQPQ
jgi:hypothetical protein